jgi:uncharacterized protein
LWAQLINLFSEIKTFLPWVSFIAGLGGSLHCVGMCGGLVTASCERGHDIVRYQLGRLGGYLILGLLAGVVGSLLQFKNTPLYFTLLPALFIGGLFIFWGIQSIQGKRGEIPLPKFYHKLYAKLWGKVSRNSSSSMRSGFTGFISIFLPCGLLYGVALGTVALQNTTDALFSMFFFWLGTTPSMVIAPGIFQRILRPLRSYLPRTYGVSLILIGIITISFRVVKISHAQQNVESHKDAQKMSCH